MKRTPHFATRHLAVALGFFLASLLYGPVATATCCTREDCQVWVPGRFTNAIAGDAVATQINSSTASVLQLIMGGIHENYGHAFVVWDNIGSLIAQNIADQNTVGKAWTCSHPIDPYSLRPIRPGIMNEYADGTAQFKGAPSGYDMIHQPATVLKGASDPRYGYACNGSTGGYDLYGYRTRITNSMCVDYLTDSCSVHRPAPRTYNSTTVYNTLSGLYNALFNQAYNSIGWLAGAWCGLLGTGNWGEADSAANQVINTLLSGNPWDTGHENWSVTVNTVVTPDNLATTWTANTGKATMPATHTDGYWTRSTCTRCYPGPCP